jgi:presequence protease
MFLDLASDKLGREILDAKLPKFAEAIGEGEYKSLGEFVDYIPTRKNEGILIPSQVQYVAQAGNLGFDGLTYNGTYRVVQSAINIDYIYQQIRVKGGAYGCGCGFDSNCDNLTFTTYRDPKLSESYNVFKGTGEFIRNYDFNEKELTKFIIGAFSGYERPISNAGSARRSFNAYMTGVTYEDVVKERAEMLDITKEQFKASAEVFDKVCAQNYICTVGNETKLKENAALFDTLITIN